MKIDLSTLFLAILCIIPGLFAQRSRNLVCPRSFVDQGASGELGELVALGFSTHGVIVIFAAILAVVYGSFVHLKPAFIFQEIDSWQIQKWAASHRAEAVLSATLYVFVSFSVSHFLGLVYGVWRLKAPISALLLTRSKRLSAILRRIGIVSILGERPIVYEVFNPKQAEDGTQFTVFVELELKNNLGFYTGQLKQYAIVRDEEPHKPIFIEDALFRRSRDDNYSSIDGGGVMIDLSDAVQIVVEQVAP